MSHYEEQYDAWAEGRRVVKDIGVGEIGKALDRQEGGDHYKDKLSLIHI